ncbi:hypothetical protein IWW38_001167 [Coemansia aciculifera]|uniref:Uncharacterized protein n=1 Tax=Coemansia aciculifera TaxID=417176 RepID=A0ACC1M929_9FUNG|nr:hypothetical protein IWW38_001167 [Coemansia aciculifera]
MSDINDFLTDDMCLDSRAVPIDEKATPMSDSNEILIHARINAMCLKTCLVPIDEKVALMSDNDLVGFLTEQTKSNDIEFVDGFVLFNTKTKKPFTESPFADGDYTHRLEVVGNRYCLYLMASHLIE